MLLQSAPLVWQQHPTARFVFVGPPSSASQRAFAGSNEPRILELGAVSEQEKADALAACTIFCLPSSQESFGMVYAEAWQMGRPVVGLDIPALREVIDHEVNGLRIARPDAKELVSALIRLLDDPAWADSLGRAGRAKVQSSFSWKTVAEATEAAYEALRR
jgi:glycosyltransferase involved in cell wall biosynthesis